MVAKASFSFVMSFRPSVFIIAAPTERVSVKFDIGDLCEDLSRRSTLGSN